MSEATFPTFLREGIVTELAQDNEFNVETQPDTVRFRLTSTRITSELVDPDADNRSQPHILSDPKQKNIDDGLQEIYRGGLLEGIVSEMSRLNEYR